MDLILIVVGGLLLFAASQQKDEEGQRTGNSKNLQTAGYVVLGIGIALFVLGFVIGFSEAT